MDDPEGRERGDHGTLFGQVFRQSHDAIVVFDPARDEIVDVNPTACSLLGYDREELLARSPTDVHPEETPAFERFVDGVLAEGEGATTSLSCRTRDGDRIPAEISAAVVEYEGRDCVMAAIRDVTERVRYVERMEALNTVGRELMAAESRTAVAETVTAAAEDLLDQPLTVVWLADEEGTRLVPVTATDRAREAAGESLPDIGPGTVEWEVFEAGDSRVVDYATVENPVAPDVPLRTTLFVPLGEYGLVSVGSLEPGGVDEAARHLLEVLAQTATAALGHVEREAALRARTADLARQNERLAEFASVVSHDLRNPLNVAQGFLEMLDTDDTETVERIDRALDRMEALVDDVLTLARQGETVDEKAAVSLAGVASACWETTAHADAELAVDPAADRRLLADEDRLRQALENLFRNAVEHGRAGTVRVGVLDVDGHDDAREDRPPAGFYVADDGAGIPAEIRDRLFEPGVTTADEGTGFGLRIVETIAEAHGWRVAAVDGADGGARFEVTGVEWVDEAG